MDYGFRARAFDQGDIAGNAGYINMAGIGPNARNDGRSDVASLAGRGDPLFNDFGVGSGCAKPVSGLRGG